MSDPSADRPELTAADWRKLAKRAWSVRDHARVHGRTKVGAAVMSLQRRIYVGCNVEHLFRSHDIHAEVNALSSMASAGEGPAVAVLIASTRDRFTPCGSCLDWIFELGGADCVVAFQGAPHGPLLELRADELMPHYPH